VNPDTPEAATAIGAVTEAIMGAMSAYVCESPERLASFIAWTDQMPGLFEHTCSEHGKESIFVGGPINARIAQSFIGAYLHSDITLLDNYPTGDKPNGSVSHHH
jgi:hypothetical protein